MHSVAAAEIQNLLYGTGLLLDGNELRFEFAVGVRKFDEEQLSHTLNASAGQRSVRVNERPCLATARMRV